MLQLKNEGIISEEYIDECLSRIRFIQSLDTDVIKM